MPASKSNAIQQKAIALYEQGMSLREAGEVLGIAGTTVRSILAKHGVNRRTEIKTTEERFWKHIKKGTSNNECWQWGAFKGEKGYGRLAVMNDDGKRRPAKAHRISWELHYGQIPPNMYVCHRCDNPECCNPAHLFLGSHEDNMADMAAKGRHTYGERSANARLTDDKVRQIRVMSASGYKYTEIAGKFGVSPSMVRKIVLRKSWKHI